MRDKKRRVERRRGRIDREERVERKEIRENGEVKAARG